MEALFLRLRGAFKLPTNFFMIFSQRLRISLGLDLAVSAWSRAIVSFRSHGFDSYPADMNIFLENAGRSEVHASEKFIL